LLVPLPPLLTAKQCGFSVAWPVSTGSLAGPLTAMLIGSRVGFKISEPSWM
jgi:hypothetical protein